MRRTALLAISLTLIAACSGDPQQPATTLSGGDGSTSTAIPGESTTSAPTAGLAPSGVVWQTLEIDPATTGVSFVGVTDIDDQTWIYGGMHGEPVIWSVSPGPELHRIDLTTESSDGIASVRGLVGSNDGGLLAYGTRAFDCHPGSNICQQSGGVVWLSVDGSTWTTVAPPAWNPGGGVKVSVNGVAAHAGGYVAVVTFGEPDWRAVLFTSNDGRTWTQGQRLESHGHGLNGVGVFSDGTNLVVQAHAFLCIKPFKSPAGWVPDVTWTEHNRIWQGTSVTDLQPVDSTEMPFVQPDLDVDCGATSALELAAEPQIEAKGQVLGGTITFLETTAINWPLEEPGGRRITRLEGGQWVTETVVPDESLSSPSSMTAFAINGSVGFVEFMPSGRGRPGSVLSTAFPHRAHYGIDLYAIRLWLKESNGWRQTVGVSPLLAGEVVGGFVDGEKVVVVGNQVSGNPRLVLWTSEEADPSGVNTCELGPGASCLGVDIAAMLGPGSSDLSGVDLNGADLRFTNLSGLNLDGANLKGARLTAAYAEGATFVGADLTGADLNHAWLEDLAGSLLDEANLTRGNFLFTSPPASTRNTNANEAQLIFGRADHLTEMQIALTGINLTWTRIIPGPENGPLLVFTDLSGSIVENTRFTRSDLSRANLSTAAWGRVVLFSEDSICPDGSAPVKPRETAVSAECT